MPVAIYMYTKMNPGRLAVMNCNHIGTNRSLEAKILDVNFSHLLAESIN